MKRLNLSDYIKNLDFEYAISYSGLRGEKFSNLISSNQKKIEQLKKDIESARYMQVPKLNRQIEALDEEVDKYRSKIIDKKGVLHPSAERVCRFERNDTTLQRILNILDTGFKSQVLALCIPVFRDVLVFYSKNGQIEGILHMCFSCFWMKNENNEDLEVDHGVFPALRAELVKVGHQITE